MLFKQSRVSGWWLLAGGAFLLLAGLAVTAWLNLGKLAGLYLEKNYHESGVMLSYQESRYNPWQRQLVLTGARLIIGEGITVNTREMELNPSWASLIFDEFQLSKIEFHHSEISINLDKLKAQEYPWTFFKETGLANLLFNSTTIKWISHKEKNCQLFPSCSVNVEMLALRGVNKEQAEVSATGQLKGAEWQFKGDLAGESKSLEGVLDIENLSLDHLNSVYQRNAKVALAGHFDGRFNLRWQVGKAPEVEGSGHTDEGGLIEKELSVKWSRVELKDIAYLSDSNRWLVEELFLDKPTIKIRDAMQPLALLLRLSELASIKNVYFKDAELSTDSLLDVRAPELNVVFQKKALSYALRGQSPKGETVQIEGTYTNAEAAQHRYRLKLSEAIAGKGLVPAHIGNYDLTGAQVQFSFNGIETFDTVQGTGSFALQKLPPGVLENNESKHRLVLALLTDSRGAIQTPFEIKKTKKDAVQSRELLVRAINSRWKVITAEPFSYLSKINGVPSKLSPLVAFSEGKSVLEAGSSKNLQAMVVALKQRPGLAVAVEGHASKQMDWPELSALELEDSLHELYRAINKEAAGSPDQEIPDDIRSYLIEQMYLRTQKMKLPEIGSQSEAQRVKTAERWLLENWPYDGESLDKLADSRTQVIINMFQDSGIKPERIKKRPSKVSESHSLSKIVLEAL